MEQEAIKVSYLNLLTPFAKKVEPENASQKYDAESEANFMSFLTLLITVDKRMKSKVSQ